jgi:Domain of unknown function (DUF6883)
VRIPGDAVIAAEKVTHYLLVERPRNDKAKFLACAGFHRGNPELLFAALRELAAAVDAVDDGTNQYGTFLRTDGDIVGPNGRRLAVTAIWLRQDERVRFLTLKPRREKKP